MGTLADWSSVAQLLCAYTLIMKGYAEYSEKTNTEAEEMLDEGNDRMQTLLAELPERGPRQHPRPTQFHWLKWHELTLPELNDHRRFLSKWYHDQAQTQKVAERRRNLTLISVGVVAFIILLMTAALKEVQINPVLGTVVALCLWGPVFDVMIKTWREDRKLRVLISLSEKPAEDPEPSPIPFPGMIYAVTNHIRRLHATKPQLNHGFQNGPDGKHAA